MTQLITILIIPISIAIIVFFVERKKILLQNPKFKNLEIHTISEVPSNSGLGSSGSLSVGLIQALNSLLKKNVTPKFLSEKSIDIEMILNKKNAGKQDQYAAAYGGLIKLSGYKYYLKKFYSPEMLKKIKNLRYREKPWPGSFRVEFNKKFELKPRLAGTSRLNIIRYMIAEHFNKNLRCKFCPDQLSDFADISLGDPHFSKYSNKPSSLMPLK